MIKMFSINVRFFQSSASVDRILFTIGKLRNKTKTTAGQHFSQAVHTAATAARLNVARTIRRQIMGMKEYSRYSANTIMPHFKEFRILDYDIIGFDLDGTLLRYDLNHMVPLEHELLIKFLVNERNYPKQLLERKFDAKFVQKGLIIDAHRGNLLKMNEDGTILRVSHGTKFLSDKEIVEVYGESRQCSYVQTFVKDPLSAWNGPLTEKLRALLDYFDMGAALVFAQTVDVLDELSNRGDNLQREDYKIWPDMLDGLIKIYTRDNFSNGLSAYFNALKENPDKYLLKTETKVIEFLKELKASGKALFLLTGSNIDFANFTASYALGPQWQELFDYTVAFAKKPGFFHMQRQFLKIQNLNEIPESEIALTDLLPPNTNYSQGNWQQLKESICRQILHKDSKDVKSLYVGDNLIQDVYAPSVVASIDTLAISEELLENDNNYAFKAIVQSPLWGSYFSDDGVPTLWSQFIKKYSQLCISDMGVIASVPIKDNIHCENKEGYFPKRPEDL